MVIQKFIVMSEKDGCWHGIKTDSLRFTYSIFNLLIPKSVLVFFTFASHFVWWHRLNHCAALVRKLPTSILMCASVSLLTFHTSSFWRIYGLQTSNAVASKWLDSRTFTFPRCLADLFCIAWLKLSNNIEGSQWQFEKKDICNY